jgi:hypothetical protein
LGCDGSAFIIGSAAWQGPPPSRDSFVGAAAGNDQTFPMQSPLAPLPENGSRRVWLLRIVPDVRFGRLLTGVGILVFLLGIYAAVGMFTEHAARATPASVAVFFAVLLAYIVPTYHYIVERCEDAFDDLAPHLDAASPEIESWRREIATRRTTTQLLILGIGITAGIGHNLALTSDVGLVRAFAAGVTQVAVIFGTMLVWIVMTSVISGLYKIALLFARIGRRTRINLLQPRELTPFARVAVILTLAIIGAQAAFPLLWLDDTVTPIAAIPGLIATGITMLFLFAKPLWPIHRAIATAKTAQIARLDAEIAAITSSGHPDAAHIAQVAPLLIYRREIESAHEWPFDTGVTGRLAIYLVIPPLTWVGAALIQHFIEGAL